MPPTEPQPLSASPSTQAAALAPDEGSAVPTAAAEVSPDAPAVDGAVAAASAAEPSKGMSWLHPVLAQVRQRQSWLVGGTIALTFILGGATGLLLRQSPGPRSIDAASELVPQGAIAALGFDQNPEPWQRLRQVGRPSLQLGLGQWLAIGRDRLITLGYGDWDEVQAQLSGDPIVALVPLAPLTPDGGASSPGAATDLLLIAPLKAPKAVAGSLAQRQPPEGFENSVSNHRGVQIWDLQTDLTQRHSVAVFGNFLIMASRRGTVEGAINSYLDDSALADLNDYQDSQRRFEGNDTPLLDLYLNVPGAKAAAQASGRALPLPDGIQGLTSRVYLAGQGLTVESLTWDQPRSEDLGLLAPQPSVNLGDQSQQMLALGDRFPTSTSFFLSGSSLRQAWQSHSQTANPASLLSPTALAQQIQAVSGMDLQKDWLSWMDGPYAVGVLPIPSRANSRFQAGLTLLVQTTNRRLGERSLQKLDALMVNKYGLRLNTSQLDGQTVVNWANAQGETLVTHGWLEGNVAFFVVGAPGANLLLPVPQATLAASPLYREGMPRTDGPAPMGQLFIDVDRVLETSLPSLLPLTPASGPLLEELKSVGVERRLLDDRLTHYHINLQVLAGQGLASEPSAGEATPPPAQVAPPQSALPPTITEPLGPPLPPPAAWASRSASSGAAAVLPGTEPGTGPQPGSDDVLLERNAPDLIGPPTPPANFDFAPIGPKLPPPQEQRWSDSFIETP